MRERSFYVLTDRGERRQQEMVSEFGDHWPGNAQLEWTILNSLGRGGMGHSLLIEKVSGSFGTDLRGGKVFDRVLGRLIRRGHIERSEPMIEQEIAPSVGTTDPDKSIPFAPVNPFGQPEMLLGLDADSWFKESTRFHKRLGESKN